jgi:hypothetical protein
MGFHTPPTSSGFYSFVWPEIERFLLGGRSFKIDKDKNETKELRDFYKYKKDPKGNRSVRDYVLEEYNEKYPEKEKSLQEFIKEFEADNLAQIEADKAEAGAKKKEMSAEEWRESGQWDYSIRQRNTPYETESKKPKIFTYEGPIWSHLEAYVKEKPMIQQRKGSWILTDFEIFKRAFSRAKLKAKLENYTKDHLEVFIERL